MLKRADKPPDEGKGVDPECQALYQKITRLRCVLRCGMCGTRRHQTQPFWNLDMRVCKYCLQTNLISNNTLDEMYWTKAEEEGFANHIAGRVFYFRHFGTARMRLEFTNSTLDFCSWPKQANVLTWFFWRPHLEQILDMPALRKAAEEKISAARQIRALARRALVLRKLNSSGRLVQWSRHPDKRAALFKLRKQQVLERAPRFATQNNSMIRKLAVFEDRVFGPIETHHEIEARD